MRFDDWNDILCHHGVKGQKWGVRRYQNSDGTLTAEGLTRYTRSKSAAKRGWNQIQGRAAKLNSAHAHYGLKAQEQFYKLNANSDRYSKNLGKFKSEADAQRSKKMQRISKKGESYFKGFQEAVMNQRKISELRYKNDNAALSLLDGVMRKYGDASVKPGYSMARSYRGTEVPTQVAKLKFGK